jgi:sedoheptulose-bisphosphatase
MLIRKRVVELLKTGRTDIPLTDRGIEQVKTRARELVGEGRKLGYYTFVSTTHSHKNIETFDPKNICTAFVSPRQRAHATFHLLFEHVPKVPDHIFTEEVREWDYGEYEGLTSSEILRKNPNWSIWTDGQVPVVKHCKKPYSNRELCRCPGGESAEDMRCRVDIILDKVSFQLLGHSFLTWVS